MVDYYEELQLNRNGTVEELNNDLSRLESTWRRREINNPEKAAKMIALIVEARAVFKTTADKRNYDRALEESKKQPENVDPNAARKQEFEKWLNNAREFYASGQFDLAKTAIENAMKYFSDLDDPAFYDLASKIYYENKDSSQALSYINKAIVMDPQWPEYYLTKGLIYNLMERAPHISYNDQLDYLSKCRESFAMAVNKADQCGENAIKANAIGALALSLYFGANPDKQRGLELAKTAVAMGETWGNAVKVLDDVYTPIYNEAEKLEQTGTLPNLKQALEKFESLSGWKDAAARADIVRERIADIEAKEQADRAAAIEKEKRRQKEQAEKDERLRKAAEEKRRRNKELLKKILKIAIPAVAAIIVIVIIMTAISNKRAADEVKIAEVIEQAEVLAVHSDYEGALETIETALVTYPNSGVLTEKQSEYTDALNAQRAVQAEIDAIIEKAQALVDNKDYEGALAVIQKGSETYPDSKDLKNKVDEYNEAIYSQKKAEALAQAEELASNGDYVSAINLIKEVQETRTDDEECNSAISTYITAYDNVMIEAADALAAGGDYLGAIVKIEEAIAAVGEDNTLSDKEDSYVETIINRVDELIEDGYYSTAKSTLDAALEVLSDNFALSDEEKVLTKAINESMALMKDLKSIAEKPEESTRLTDNYGNHYDSAIESHNFYNDSQEYEYLLNAEYNRFTCTLYVPEGTNDDDVVYFSITTDRKIVYTSPEMKETSRPVDVDIDISGCNDFIFTWYFSRGRDSKFASARCVADATFSKGREQTSNEEGSESEDTAEQSDGNESVYMKDLTSIAEKPNNSTSLTDNYGNRYNTAIESYNRYNDTLAYEYLLDMKYNHFKCVLYVPEGTDDDDIVYFTVSTDGNVIYTSPEMDLRSYPVDVDVDISGCNDFVFTWYFKRGSDTKFASPRCIANATFYQ